MNASTRTQRRLRSTAGELTHAADIEQRRMSGIMSDPNRLRRVVLLVLVASIVLTFASTSAGRADAGSAAAATGTVSGTVRDGVTGIAGIEVAAFDGVTGVSGPATSTVGDGSYELEGLEAGSHLLRFSDEAGRFATAFHPGAVTADAAAPVVVPGGAEVTIDAVLSAAFATLHGEVTDAATGAPVGGITVDVIDDLTGAVLGTMTTAAPTGTDPGGTFQLEVPAGDLLVRFTDPSGRYLGMFHDGSGSAQSALPLAVSAGESVENLDATLQLDRAIMRGTAGSDISGPLAGVAVTAIDTASGAVIAEAVSGETGADLGRYELEVPSGGYLIHFSDPDPDDLHLDAFHPDAPSADLAIVVDAVAGDTHRVDGVMVRDQGWIYGEVVTAGDNPIGIGGAVITAIDVTDGAVRGQTESAQTGEIGLFELAVPSGDYLFRVSDPHGVYASQFHAGATFADTAEVISVTPRTNHYWSVHMVPVVDPDASGTARLTGEVVGLADPYDQQLQGARADVFDLATGGLVATTTTDGQGEFDVEVPVSVLPGEDGGRFAVRVSDPSGVHLPSWVASPAPGTMADSVVWVLAPGDSLDPAVTLYPAWATLQGAVSSGPDPLPGASVTVFDLATGRAIVEADTTTDGAGAFHTPVPVDAHVGGEPRRVVVRVHADGQAPVWHGAPGASMPDAQVLPLHADQTTSLDLSLLPDVARIAGRVRDAASDDPLTGILVEAFDLGSGDVITTAVTSNGMVSLEVPAPSYLGTGSPPSSYALRASDPTGAFEPAWIGVGDGLSSASPYEVYSGDLGSFADASLVPATGTATGTVLGHPDRTVVPGATVGFVAVTTGEAVVGAAAVTGSDGTYTATLPVGTYLVRATADDRAAGWYLDASDLFGGTPVVVSWDTPTTDVDISLAAINEPPVIGIDAPTTGIEGEPSSLEATVTDPDGDALSLRWTVATPGYQGEPICTFSDPAAGTTSFTCTDDGVFTVTLTVDDGVNDPVSDDVVITVVNADPDLGVVTVSTAGPVAVGRTILVEAPFSDRGANDAHTWIVDWGDGIRSEGSGGSPVRADHAYAATGVYVVTVTVTDDDGGSGHEASEYLAVYDPDGSFVTGGGWIDSPAGAYLADAEASGKATFGFVSRYTRGASTPDGSTEFRFEAVGLEFLSTSYEWLVVSGDVGRFKGEGTLSGVGNVRFMLWASDGALKSTGEPDTFRLRIWQEDADGAETTMYDNGADRALGGGSIVVHSKNNER